jgi:hypothetical protein
MPDKCAFCGANIPLVKSHIIPQGLYWGLHDDNTRSPVIASPYDNEYQKRRPNGIWDRFLCEPHEMQFNSWDKHAVDVLRDGNHLKVNGGWQYAMFEYHSLKLFFISLLWRAHATTDIFFDRVNLGPHAERLRRLIETNCSGRPSDYAVMLWRSDELIARAIIAPFFERFEGVRFLRFYLPGYMAYIKVDQQSTPAGLRGRELPTTGSWFVEKKVYAGNSEAQAMLHTGKINWDKKNAKQH